jgi:hypothetical protein
VTDLDPIAIDAKRSPSPENFRPYPSSPTQQPCPNEAAAAVVAVVAEAEEVVAVVVPEKRIRSSTA